jgi:lysozyme family protein
MAVNIGEARAAMLLQTVLRVKDKSVKVDGLIGPKTELAISRYPGDLFGTLQSAQVGYYVANAIHTNQNHFRNGWVNRVTVAFDEAISNLDQVREELLTYMEVEQKELQAQAEEDEGRF